MLSGQCAPTFANEVPSTAPAVSLAHTPSKPDYDCFWAVAKLVSTTDMVHRAAGQGRGREAE